MLEVRNITKIYKSLWKKKVACSNVSFIVKEGEIASLLGLNGAGKSTILKIIAGLTLPTTGDVIIEGKSIINEEMGAKREIGYLSENIALYDELSVNDFLLFSIEMRGIRKKDAWWLVKDVLSNLELEEIKDQKIATLSRGYKQRVAFAATIAAEPRVLILDEPTANLDTLQIKAFEKKILQMDKTKVILISTHNLDLANELCTKHILLHNGDVMLQGNIEELGDALKEKVENEDDIERDKVLEMSFELFGGVKKSEFFKG